MKLELFNLCLYIIIQTGSHLHISSGVSNFVCCPSAQEQEDTCDPDIRPGHTTRTYDPDIRPRHTTRTYDPDIRPGHTIRTYDPDIRPGHTTRTYDLGIRPGHTT